MDGSVATSSVAAAIGAVWGGSRSAASDDVSALAGSTNESNESGEVMDMYRELERLEMRLIEERQTVQTLMEEKAGEKESYMRDIASLEAMLQSTTLERDRLAAENATLSAQLSRSRSQEQLTRKEAYLAMTPCSAVGGFGFGSASASECAISTTAASELLDRSCEFNFESLTPSHLSLSPSHRLY
mmetsp:Transcript_46353/g.148878  ORF Transcript_46353/g.148878 Transcript_46353/m.148878 type:complete len:186 (-) Transcript_46353:156-713(-)